jgi:hypothetical protein
MVGSGLEQEDEGDRAGTRKRDTMVIAARAIATSTST